MSDPIRPSFAESLLAQDEVDARTSERIKQELQSMMTHEISPNQTIFFYVLSLVLLSAGGLFGYLAIIESLPPLARLGLVLGVGFAIAWAWKTFRVAQAGQIDLKRDNRMIANMVWFFTVAMATVMLMAAGFKEDLSNRKLILITGQALFFLIAAATYLITQRMEQVELTTRERLLRLELKLAESDGGSESDVGSDS